MRLLSVNVGHPQLNPWKTMKLTGIDKRPVEGLVMVTRPRAKGMGMVGLAGDRVYDVREHGGPDRAKSRPATRSRSCTGPITTSASRCRSGH
jgi:MOSC domain-containing protein YiiM